MCESQYLPEKVVCKNSGGATGGYFDTDSKQAQNGVVLQLWTN